MTRYTHICEDCGNYDKFRGVAVIREVVEEIHLITGEEDFVDCLEREIVNDEPRGSYDDIECDACGSNNVDEIDYKDLLEYRYEHTRKDGTWSKEELPENKRNFKIMEEALIQKLSGEKE